MMRAARDGVRPRKVLIGCDVDPVLPELLSEPPRENIWAPLAGVSLLIEALGDDLPPITWLIRADETVRHCTGDYASGFTALRETWTRLEEQGHELGWHMHLLSPDGSGTFVFDPRPGWLGEAHAALARHFPIRATRTGWTYGSDFLFGALDELGVEIDFSALPGHLAWYRYGPTTVHVDWLRCPEHTYRPGRRSYQRPGADALDLIEVPVARFPNPPLAMARRLAWRALHGRPSLSGLGRTIRLITQAWTGLPVSRSEVWAFYFHPEDLTSDGIGNLRDNVERLRGVAGVEFVTAHSVRRWYDETGLPGA